jgi:hypothetical protein
VVPDPSVRSQRRRHAWPGELAAEGDEAAGAVTSAATGDPAAVDLTKTEARALRAAASDLVWHRPAGQYGGWSSRATKTAERYYMVGSDSTVTVAVKSLLAGSLDAAGRPVGALVAVSGGAALGRDRKVETTEAGRAWLAAHPEPAHRREAP